MESKNIVMSLPIAVDVGAIEAAVEKATIGEVKRQIVENYFSRGYRNGPTQVMENLVDSVIDSIFNTETKKAEITELVADKLAEKLGKSKKFREGVTDAINGAD